MLVFYACSATGFLAHLAAHTLGNALRDVMWLHPHVQLASYTQEHPSDSEILVRCQTSGAISAEQAVCEALGMTKDMLSHMAATMEDAMAAWQDRQAAGNGQQAAHEPMDQDS
jgi:DNA-directed RNA polymerase subunit L